MTWVLLMACSSPGQGSVVTGPRQGDDRDQQVDEEPVQESGADDTEPPEPTYSSSWAGLDADRRAQMTGVTWKDGCPVPLDDLVLMQIDHWDLEGQETVGLLVVAKAHAADLDTVFEAMWQARFPIRSMRPALEFGGSDDASMAADNTSAFNCRAVTGGSSYSEHSYGHAIDINPRENPYVKGGTVLPPEGVDYLIRDGSVPGLIVEGDVVTTSFASIGWGWGGDWGSLKDYQHFSATGN